MKKFLNFIILSSVALLFSSCISGWRGLVPYNLQPSYHQFKNMCKLNELPNNEEKYNKILSYFNKKLGDIDDFPHTKHYSRGIGEITLYVFYHQYLKEYDETSLEGKLAINKMAGEAPKEKYILDSNNIKSMYLAVAWQTNRYYLDGNEGSGFYWNEEKLQCIDVASKGVKNE